MTEQDQQTLDLHDELRAAREVIATLQRRIERADQARSLAALPVEKAIASLENTVAQRTRELQASEAHYRALFDHNPNLGFLIDDIGIIVRANAAATALLGELVDRPLIEVFEPEHRDIVEQLLTAGEGHSDEVTLRGGHIVDINLAAVPGHGHTQVSMRDVSARVELGRELQHARRLAAVGHLAAGVAHEINNPLAVLELGLGELLERSADASPERAKLRELLAHAHRIAHIAANLQTFARPAPPVRAPIELVELFRAARGHAGQALAGVSVHERIEPPGASVLADRGQLEQVLVNLLTNAAQAMQGHGKDRGNIHLEASVRAHRAIIRVSDEGPGIDPNLLEHIFNPFVAGTPFGSGLGLAISWGLMRENQGSIRVGNRPEGGASFELDLPLAPSVAPPEPSPTPAPATAPAKGAGLRILCVEDEPSLRKSLMRMLGLGGHEVIGVECAEEAVEALEAGAQFDVVISDVRLPQMTGDELLALIRERYPALSERVVLMSGYFPEHQVVPHFLQKPFSLRQLRALIDAIVAA